MNKYYESNVVFAPYINIHKGVFYFPLLPHTLPYLTLFTQQQQHYPIFAKTFLLTHSLTRSLYGKP